MGIFTEHCLEHLRYPDVYKVLYEFLRILKPGGTLRIIVPDAELYIDIYQRGKKGEKICFPYGKPAYTTIPEGRTPIMAVSEALNLNGDHRSLYDYATLEIMLKCVGFIDICRKGFRHGMDTQLLIDLEHRAVESLYVEASAPVR